MDSIEKASFLMGKSYTKTQEGATHSSNVTMITGTATSDSADGVVSVDLGGNTISDDDVQSVEISTTVNVKEGDTVQVNVIGADGTAKSLLVTGVIAGGDRMQADIETAKDTSAAADAAAAVAKENAEKANELASSAITNANTANEQAQAAMDSVNTANGKISTLQKNVDTMNSDISTAQTAISKNASDISGINQKLSTDYATKGEVSDVKVAVESDIDTRANAITASVAETYAAKSDVSKIEGELSNRISVNEKGISSTSDSVTKLQSETKNISDDVNAAQAAADAAQKTADAATADASAAQTAADKAQSTANGASTAAANAQSAADSASTAASNAQTAANSARTAADNAKSAADKANSDLAKLTDTVTTQGTKIDQNSGSITSVANRTTTVENKFTNYYTKTETNSQIKQTADGINSTVSKKVGKDEVISSINQSAEEVKINANRVAINGTLSVTDAISNAQTAADNAQSTANTAKNNAATAQNTANNASTAAIDAIKAMSTGTMLYTDPCFANGMNGVKLYDNSHKGNTKIERVAKSSDNPFSNTNYELKITNTGEASPSCGGFEFATQSRANAKFIYRFIAKAPSGKPIQFATNVIGGGGKWKWLTSRAGTGKFTEYIVEVDCGSSGTFSTTGFFYLDANWGTASNPIEWRVAYATCIDMTSASDAVIAKTTANATKTYFYNDSTGSHVVSQNSTSAGSRTDIKADGMHVIDQDDGKELASFTSNGASIGKDSKLHSKYTSDGVLFYKGGESYPFSQIKPVTYENEKYSAAVFATAPDDISTDDGLYHSGATVDVTAINGTATDNTGTGRVVLTATTVQSADPKSAYIDVFASNNNPNKASGGKTVEDTYINLVAEGIYFNSKPLIDYFYPVGAIYISVNATSPAELFGGSWEQIKDKQILAAGDTYKVGTDYGSATHRHQWGYHMWGYYGHLAAASYNESCFLLPHNYDTGGADWGSTGGEWGSNTIGVTVNGNTSASAKNVSAAHKYRVGYTDKESGLDPSYVAYVWRRIA